MPALSLKFPSRRAHPVVTVDSDSESIGDTGAVAATAAAASAAADEVLRMLDEDSMQEQAETCLTLGSISALAQH